MYIIKYHKYLGTYTRQIAIAQGEIGTGLEEIIRSNIRHGSGSKKLFPFQVLFGPISSTMLIELKEI